MRSINWGSVWSVVEPIELTFALQIDAKLRDHNYDRNPLKSIRKPLVPMADIEAAVAYGLNHENQSLEAIAAKVGISMRTVRRVCRTLKLGPYRVMAPQERKPISSQVPFGWQVDAGILKRYPAEWEWVLLAYELSSQGKSLHKIAAHFTDCQVPTKNGGRWFAKTISQILGFNSSYLKPIPKRKSK